MAQWKQIRRVSMRIQVPSLASLSGLSIQLATNCGLDAALLWLWPATAALIHPLAWEFPYAEGAAKKKKKKKKKKKEKQKENQSHCVAMGHKNFSVFSFVQP